MTYSKTNTANKTLTIITLIYLSLFTTPILAKDYKVEIIIFENLVKNRVFEPHTYESPKSMVSNSDNWLIEPTMLVEAAEAINNSKEYKVLQHYSWGQESLPFSQSTAYQVVDERLNGWIKIYATQLLFANVDIDFNGYRMNEKRRLKLNERHFFDHPKFGLLMQVSRLEEDIDEQELNQDLTKTN